MCDCSMIRSARCSDAGAISTNGVHVAPVSALYWLHTISYRNHRKIAVYPATCQRRKGYMHAKTLSIDGEVCSVGSANLDIRSLSINYELNAVIYDARLAQELVAAFERDLNDCYPFDAFGYQRSPVLSGCATPRHGFSRHCYRAEC
jgi:phosphatidylserine/phosphatidylglycerophosphate/cardiolipin synthase-like enzyme